MSPYKVFIIFISSRKGNVANMSRGNGFFKLQSCFVLYETIITSNFKYM